MISYLLFIIISLVIYNYYYYYFEKVYNNLFCLIDSVLTWLISSFWLPFF
uniref:Uncharacterized protein n=1 Tax=Lepeophtheirus salmonis TaxID=72036 RepID=A0A0K2TFP6_LEPSM